MSNLNQPTGDGQVRGRAHFVIAVVVAAFVLLAVACAIWLFRSTGFAFSSTYTCGLEEHAHTDDCYSYELVCGMEEPDEADLQEIVGDEVDGDEEDLDNLVANDEDVHVHTDACYEKVLTCGLEEHTHTDACKADSDADGSDANRPKTLADDSDKLNGDYAYLTSVMMESGSNDGNSMTTGTAPWDTTEGDGNDTTKDDKILRTYDTANYTVTMTTKMRDDAPQTTYTTGDLYFELLIEGTSSEVQWETSAMSFLESKNGVYAASSEVRDGKTYQVLRGYVTLAPGTDDGHAIGNSTQTLTLGLRALALKNGDKLAPQFTFFLAYNDVGLSDEEYAAWGTEAYDGPCVTLDGQDCKEHGEAEYKTIDAPEITISATPRYNLRLRNSSASKTQAMGAYDFSTGNDYALNKGDKTYYGRMGSYGLALEIEGKSADDGLRGVQLPTGDDNLALSFNLSISSTYTANSTTYTTGEESNGQDLTDYAPLVWSFDANAAGTSQRDGRAISTSVRYADTLPYNKKGQTSGAVWYNSCSDGGTWSITPNNDGSYQVNVSDCVLDMNQLPYTYPGGNALTYSFYNPNNIDYSPNDDSKNNYWEVQYAYFSAGELWVVQPYYAPYDSVGGERDDSTYIAGMLGEGTYRVTSADAALGITQGSETVLPTAEGTTNQTDTTDDSQGQAMALVNPGSIDQHIAYVKYDYAAYNDPLTDGCFLNGKDWIMQGSQLAIEDYISNDQAEEGSTGVAYDALVKFDDVFFEPDGTVVQSAVNRCSISYLFAAKKDGNGWDHQGLQPDGEGYDTDMINATPDDLVYYSTISDLENAGKTCVGILYQYRGLMTEQQNHLHAYIKGSCKADAPSDQVYMVTPYARSWDRDDLAKAMVADPNTDYESESAALSALMAMERTEVNALVDQYIPSRTADNSLSYEDESGQNAIDYPSCHWINGDSRHPDTASGGSSRTPTILNFQKTYYDEDGCHERTSGYYWGDSCLVVGYKSGLSIDVAQQTTSQGSEHAKSTYDMDTSQTVVDYVVHPFINRNNGEGSSSTVTYDDEVVVTVTLPKNLTYIEGSAYIGGTYETTTEGKQGTVTGGTQLITGQEATFTYTVDGTDYTVGVTLEVVDYPDGTQVLTYTFTHVPITGEETPQLLENIYFSCDIASGAVKNGDQLVVDSTITCTSDKSIDPSVKEDGESTVGIIIAKNTAISLAKNPDQTVVEINSDMGFTMEIGNNSDNPMTMVAVDSLPYYGDSHGTSITHDDCTISVTEFSAYDPDNQVDLSTSFYFFYTTDKDYATKTSADYPEGEAFVEGLDTGDPKVVADTSVWTQIDLSGTAYDDNGHLVFSSTDFPEEVQIYSIVGIGIVEGDEDLAMHVTLHASNPEPGDLLANVITQQHAIKGDNDEVAYENLNDLGRSRFVGRTVTGTVWLDEDVDGGIRTGMYSNEQELSGVDVTLQMKDDSGNWVTAQKLKYDEAEGADAVTTTDADGYYKFEYLPAGECRVVFSGEGVGDGSGETYVLADHDLTTLRVLDDSVTFRDNSKAVREDGTDEITDITLPTISQITTTYYQLYQNAGYTKGTPFTVNKVWEDVAGDDITAEKETGSVTVDIKANNDVITRTAVLNHDNSWTDTISDLPYYDGNGSAVDYTAADFTVEEIEGNEGYTEKVGEIVKNDEDNSYSVVVTNRASVELPSTGGMGTTLFYLIGGLLVLLAGGLLIFRRFARTRW